MLGHSRPRCVRRSRIESVNCPLHCALALASRSCKAWPKESKLSRPRWAFGCYFDEGWRNELTSLNLEHTDDCSMRSVLGDPVKIQQWIVASLPNDVSASAP
eukprot:249394-Amphidinium_carterae.1